MIIRQQCQDDYLKGINMTLILPLIYFILLSGMLAMLADKDFGYCVPPAMLLTAFVMYFGQMLFHTFKISFIFMTAISLIGFSVLFVKADGERRKRVFSAGFYVFLGIFILYLIIDYHRSFVIFDEYRHWGFTVKESLRLDRFYSVNESNCGHKDYPPLICLFEVFWCLLTGKYSEMIVSMAIHVFQISFFVLPLIESLKVSENSKLKIVLTGIVSSLAALSVFLSLDPWDTRITTSILLDILMSVVFAYSVFVVHSTRGKLDRFSFLCLLLSNSALLMLKQVGIGFLLVVEFFYLCCLLLVQKKDYTEYVKLMSALVIPFLIYTTWTAYIKKLGITGQFSLGKISFSTYFRSLVGREPGIIHDTLKNFIIALFQKQINTVNIFPLTFMSAYVFVLLCLYFIYILNKKTIDKKRVYILGATFTCGTFGYAFMMSVLYAFCFNKAEMQQLASYERYMATYVLGEVLIMILLSAKHFSDNYHLKINLKSMSILSMILMVTLNPSNMLYISPQIIRGNSHAEDKQDAEFLNVNTEAGDKIFVIYDMEKKRPKFYGAYLEILSYYNNDRVIDYEITDVFDYDFSSEDNIDYVISEIGNNDYLYVRHINDGIKSVVSRIYDGEIQENKIYKVVHSGNTYHIEDVKMTN